MENLPLHVAARARDGLQDVLVKRRKTQTNKDKKCLKGYVPSYLEGDEECVVCGDKATGYHYRCITCEGCKGFFRRTVQKTLDETYHCKYDGKCEISKITRNQCQLCRYNKCIVVGMATELVLNESKRVAKRRLIEHNREQRRCKELIVKTDFIKSNEEGTSIDDNQLIAEIVKAHSDALMAKQITDSCTQAYSRLPPRERFSTAINRAITGVVDFAKRIPLFSNKIMFEDQVEILKYSCIDAIVVRAVTSYDANRGTLHFLPFIIVREVQLRNTRLSSCTEGLFKLAKDFNSFLFSAEESALLEAVVIFKDRPSTNHVKELREGCTQLTRAYQRRINEYWRDAVTIWPKLLSKIDEIQRISENLAQAIMEMQNGKDEDFVFLFMEPPAFKRETIYPIIDEIVTAPPYMNMLSIQSSPLSQSNGISFESISKTQKENLEQKQEHNGVVSLSPTSDISRSESKGALSYQASLACSAFQGANNIVDAATTATSLYNEKNIISVSQNRASTNIDFSHSKGDIRLQHQGVGNTKKLNKEYIQTPLNGDLPSFTPVLNFGNKKNSTALENHPVRKHIRRRDLEQRPSSHSANSLFSINPTPPFTNPFPFVFPLCPAPLLLPRFPTHTNSLQERLKAGRPKPTDRWANLHKSMKL